MALFVLWWTGALLKFVANMEKRLHLGKKWSHSEYGKTFIGAESVFYFYFDSDEYSACSTSVSTGVWVLIRCFVMQILPSVYHGALWGSVLGFLFVKILLLGRTPWGDGGSKTVGSPTWNADVHLNTEQFKCCSNEKDFTHAQSTSVYGIAPCVHVS